MESRKDDIAALKSHAVSKDKSSAGSSKHDEGETSWNPSYGDPRGWILKAEKYFRCYNVPENERGTGIRQELAKHSSRVSNWLERCLLWDFLNGLKEELKANVRIEAQQHTIW